jgi:uncharacterized protein
VNVRSAPLVFWEQYDESLDDDCACPDKAFRLEHKTVADASFQQLSDVYSTALPDSFHLAYSPFAPGGPCVLNQSAWDVWQSFTNPRPLNNPVDRLLSEQHLIHPQENPPTPIPQQPETLTVWLHVSNACNLDCPYCYVRKSSTRMDEETGLRALQSVFQTARKNGFKRVKLKYAGGEATLHFKLIRILHEQAVLLSCKSNLALKEVVLSNGVHLRPADADWLKANKIKLMISLDGIGEAHDRQRPLKGGGSTFQQVAHTVDEILLQRGIQPDITMTVTGLNALNAADVAKWALIDRGLPTSFNFYRQNLLTTSRQDLNLEEQNIIEGMLAAYAVIEQNIPDRPFFNGLLDRVQAEAHTHTCGVGQSYLVISHTGKLSQCQMHLDTAVGSIHEENLLPMVAAGPIHNLSVDQKEGCRQCVYRYRCSGGCPIETFRATGRWDVQSPNCHIYKTLLPAALRLEGLRLMKVNGFLN